MRSLPFGSPIPTILYHPGANSLSVTFKTHLNYIKCMTRLTEGLVINIHISPHTPLETRMLVKFDTLARITTKSIQGEKDACDREKAYAQVASPWIPVKCYYRLYYLESIFFLFTRRFYSGIFSGWPLPCQTKYNATIKKWHSLTFLSIFR
jgi:hypothetical protein